MTSVRPDDCPYCKGKRTVLNRAGMYLMLCPDCAGTGRIGDDIHDGDPGDEQEETDETRRDS